MNIRSKEEIKGNFGLQAGSLCREEASWEHWDISLPASFFLTQADLSPSCKDFSQFF